MTKQYKIGWMPGDGIGVDVLEAAKIVLDSTNFNAEYIPLDIGWEIFKQEGDPLPDRTLDSLKSGEIQAALFGAITSKPASDPETIEIQKKHNVKYRSPIVRLRQELDLYSNMRPAKSYEGHPHSYRYPDTGKPAKIDITYFRENTEGLYAGVGFSKMMTEFKQFENVKNFMRFKPFDDDSFKVNLRIFTRQGCEKIIRKAFYYARENKRNRVIIVHKANVVRETCGLFMDIGREIAKEFEDIEVKFENVDAHPMFVLKDISWYYNSVVVTSNLFGDILTDFASQLIGGLGMQPSASVSGPPDKPSLGLFEPSHGSAPKHAGQYRVNPTAAILSAKLMLEQLGKWNEAQKIDEAVAQVIKEKRVVTYDLGGDSGTLDMAREIAKLIE